MEVDSGYVNLDYVVASVAIAGNMDDRWYEKMLQIVIEGYMELNYTDVITETKTAYLTVNSQNVAYFPRDYISYISIAIQSGGRLVPLTLNRNIVIPTVQECGVWVREGQTDTNGQFDQTSDIYSDDAMNHNYTIGGGFNVAYYRIDEANKQIIFLKANYNGLTIVLDYKGTGLTSNNVIPRDAVPALKSYLRWQLADNSKKSNEAEVYRMLTRWQTERMKLYARRHAFTMDEFLDKRYENTHRGLK